MSSLREWAIIVSIAGVSAAWADVPTWAGVLSAVVFVAACVHMVMTEDMD